MLTWRRLPDALRRLTHSDRKLLAAYALLAGGASSVSPFAASWLQDRGVELGWLGFWLALPLLLRALVSAPLAAWAQRQASPATSISCLAGLTCLAGLGALLLPGSTSAIVSWILVSLSWQACFPLLDSVILADGDPRRGAQVLSWAKACGSLAYVAANVLIGVCYSHGGATVVIVWVTISTVPVIFLAPSLLSAEPDKQRQRNGPAASTSVSAPMQAGTIWLVLLAAGLIEASHGFHTTALVGWRDRGINLDFGGLLWGAGAFFDILFLLKGTAFRAKVGPWCLLVMGGLAAMTRWIGFALSPNVETIFLLQALHALSFTATSLASIELMSHLPARARVRAQITNWALTTGLAKGAMVILSTPLYALYGVAGYWPMAAMALCGAIVAMIGWARQTSVGFTTAMQAKN